MSSRKTMRATVGGVDQDVPIGTFSAGQFLRYNSTGGPGSTPIIDSAAGGGGSGDVVGPASSVDNHLALFNGVTGKLLKDTSPLVVDGAGNINGVNIGIHSARHIPGGADSVFPGTYTAGDVAQWGGVTFAPKRDMVQSLSADITGIGATLTNIFIHTLPRAGTYWFHYELLVACNTAAAQVVQLQLVTGAGVNVTRYAFTVRMQTAGPTPTVPVADVVAAIRGTPGTSGNLVTASHSPATTNDRIMSVVGSATVTAGGNFTLQLNRAGGAGVTISCFQGSSLRITEQ